MAIKALFLGLSMEMQIRLGIMIISFFLAFLTIGIIQSGSLIMFSVLYKELSVSMDSLENKMIENVLELTESIEEISIYEIKFENSFIAILYDNYHNKFFGDYLFNFTGYEEEESNLIINKNFIDDIAFLNSYFNFSLPIIKVILSKSFRNSKKGYNKTVSFQYINKNKNYLTLSYNNNTNTIDYDNIFNKTKEFSKGKYLTIIPFLNKRITKEQINNDIDTLQKTQPLIDRSILFNDNKISVYILNDESLFIFGVDEGYLQNQIMDIRDILPKTYTIITNVEIDKKYSNEIQDDQNLVLYLDQILTPFSCILISKLSFLNKIDYIPQKELKNVSNCFMNTIQNFLVNKNPLGNFRKSVYITSNSTYIKTKTPNTKFRFKLFKSFYPNNAINRNEAIIKDFLFTDMFVNFILFNTVEITSRTKKLRNEGLVYIFRFLILLLIFWFLILIYLMVSVFRVSREILGPINSLLKRASMGGKYNEKKMLNVDNYLMKTSYQDDYLIDKLINLAKSIIFQNLNQRHMRKLQKINQDSNISIFKLNNIIIKENEFLENKNTKEINYFEEHNPIKEEEKDIFNNKIKKVSDKFNLLSNKAFTKLFKENVDILTKNKGYFHIYNDIQKQLNSKK